MDETEKCSAANNNHNSLSTNSTLSGRRWSRYQVFKNLICISFAIYLLFTAMDGIVYIQSTINNQHGMGVISEAVTFAVMSLSSLFLPKIVIRKLGCKLALALSMLVCNCPAFANLFPRWETLITSAFLSGTFGSILWPSACTYLNKLSELYHDHADSKGIASSAALFIGISGTCFLLSQTTGNLISYSVLKNHKSNSSNITEYRCGILFEENNTVQANNTNLQEVDKDLRNILFGIYICLSIFSVLPIAFFLDPLPKNDMEEEEGNSLVKRVMATFGIMKQKQQLLLMPFALYYGMQDAFYMGDVTRTYIACSWDVSHIGLVSVCQGVSAGFGSTLSGRLQKYTGRTPLYATAAVLNIVAFIQLFLWTPDPGKPAMYFLFSGIWGSFNGIYLAQIRALYGHLFRGEEESAFANCYTWMSIGRCLSFVCSRYLFIVTKLCLLITVFCLAQVGYLLLELNIRNSTIDEEMDILPKKVFQKK